MKLVYGLLTLSLMLASADMAISYRSQHPERYLSTVSSYQPVLSERKPTNTEMSVAPKSAKLEVIELTADNMVVMDKVFNDQSVTEVMMSLQKLSEKLPSHATIYLVLNTPGGSVDSGIRLASYIKALPQKVKTLTLFSASMGFHLAQQLDERLILDTGTMMSHRAKFACKGEAEGEIEQCMKYTMSMINSLEARASERMQISLPEYKNLIRDEYWAYGQNAVNEHSADRVVLAHCGKSLGGTKMVTFETFFGDFDVEMSNCPLMPGFISAKPRGDMTKVNNKIGLEYVTTLFNNKELFVRNYIVNNEWLKFQK